MNSLRNDPVAHELSRLAVPFEVVQPNGRFADLGAAAELAVLVPPEAAAKAKRLYVDRRRRADAFGEHADLFGEPAWDILLDLFIAWSEARPVRVSDSCVAAAVPRTTALRWLQTLAQRGLVERMDDHRDARSSIIRLTPRALDMIGRYLTRTV